jgi:MoaA/NifB/PqqE/SkfB family radical SAM enzyme
MNLNLVNKTRIGCALGTKMRFGPDGIHLFARSSGMNLLIEEVVPPRSMWTTAPRQVSIALTNACDLACSYCFAPKTRATLAFERVVSWLIELDANGTLGVGFGGGEPTLYPRFAELCAHTAKNTGLAVTFTTHGHHLDDQLIRKLKGNVHFLRMSMDGVGATYERLRGRSFAAFEKRLQTITGAIPFGVNYVINSDTFPDLDAAVDFAQQAGAAEFLFLPQQPVGNNPGIDQTSSQRLRSWVSRYRGGMRLAISEQGADGIPTCDPFKKENGLHKSVHIDAHGVLKTTSYALSGIPIGADTAMSALTKLSQQTKALYENLE